MKRRLTLSQYAQRHIDRNGTISDFLFDFYLKGRIRELDYEILQESPPYRRVRETFTDGTTTVTVEYNDPYYSAEGALEYPVIV